MEITITYFIVFLTILLSVPSYADMYSRQQGMMMSSRPAKVIHVHHYDAGSSGSMMGSMKKESSSGSSLIELLILSSLLSGTTANTGTQTGILNGQLVPIQNG